MEVTFRCSKCGQVTIAHYDGRKPVASGADPKDAVRYFKCSNPDCGQWNGVEVSDA